MGYRRPDRHYLRPDIEILALDRKVKVLSGLVIESETYKPLHLSFQIYTFKCSSSFNSLLQYCKVLDFVFILLMRKLKKAQRGQAFCWLEQILGTVFRWQSDVVLQEAAELGFKAPPATSCLSWKNSNTGPSTLFLESLCHLGHFHTLLCIMITRYLSLNVLLQQTMDIKRYCNLPFSTQRIKNHARYHILGAL